VRQRLRGGLARARLLRRQREGDVGRTLSAQRVADSAPDHLVDERRLEEPHLGLRGMHVDVEAIGRHLEEQVGLGAAFLDRRTRVCHGDRVLDAAVPDDAPVHEQRLRPAQRTLFGEARDEPEHAELSHLA